MNEERKMVAEMSEEEFEGYIKKLNSKKNLKKMRLLLLWLSVSLLGIVFLLEFTIAYNRILTIYLLSFVSFFLILMSCIDSVLKENRKLLFDLFVLILNSFVLILIH